MNKENTKVNQESSHGRVCPPQIVKTFDNFLRPLIHKPQRLFGKYLKPGMIALDVGCGAGFASIEMAKMVGVKGKVIAADLQPEMLRMVKARADKKGLSDIIHLHRCESKQIGLSEKIDFAIAFWVFHELPDKQAFLREIYANLRNGGALFIAEPKMHVSKNEMESIIQLAEKAGFKRDGISKVRLSNSVVLIKSAKK